MEEPHFQKSQGGIEKEDYAPPASLLRVDWVALQIEEARRGVLINKSALVYLKVQLSLTWLRGEGRI
jgi:hypothetical protein